MTVSIKIQQYVTKQKKFVFGEHIYSDFEKLGLGGQAAAFKALSLQDNCSVTIRVFIKETDSQRLERQIQQMEGQATDLPFVQRSIRYHEILVEQKPSTCITGKSVFVQVLDFAPNRLQDEIENNTLTAEQQEIIIKQLATALYKMHDRKLIHRDVKPDNIYLDKDLNCMLSDMGIARSSDCSLKTQIGTPSYTAPEVWKVALQGECQNFAKYDIEVDAWSLGCVYYYMQTGKDLFEGLYGADQIETFLKDEQFEEFDAFPKQIMQMLIQVNPERRKFNWNELRSLIEIK